MTSQPQSSLWSLSSWLDRSQTPPQHTSSSSTLPSPTSQSAAFLQLPADILLTIWDHLDTPTALALSLACQSTYAVCFAMSNTKLKPNDKQGFLLLLEKDPLGANHYYCFTCCKLHKFDKAWRPRDQSEPNSRPCTIRDQFSPTGNAFGLSYSHARLVMNKHFYGPNHGIALENIRIQHDEPRGPTTIRCATDAQIINDELVLQRSYSFTLTNDQVEEFRKCTGPRDFKLCEHTAMFANSTQFRQHIPELGRSSWGGVEAMVPCDQVAGSCGLCLMDYDVTITRDTTVHSSWNISINAYHLLGQCRSPADWKWARFTEISRSHLFLPNRPNRRGSRYTAGSIRQLWNSTCPEQTSSPYDNAASLLLPSFVSNLKWAKFLTIGMD